MPQAELEGHVFIYWDDVIICTSTFEKHVKYWRKWWNDCRIALRWKLFRIAPSRSVKEVRQVVGLVSWYVEPPALLTRKGVLFNWNGSCETALKELKDLVSAPILACPEFRRIMVWVQLLYRNRIVKTSGNFPSWRRNVWRLFLLWRSWYHTRGNQIHRSHGPL